MAHIEYLINNSKHREASRFVTFANKDLMTPKLISLYKDIIESGRYADIAGQILEDVVVKYDVHPAEWQLTSLRVTDGAWGREVAFNGVNFTGSAFRNAGFYGTKFINCNLSDSQFLGCSFHDVALDGSDLHGTRFLPGVGWRDRISMTGSNLEECNLVGCLFENIYTFYEYARRGHAAPQVPKPSERLSFARSNLSGASFKNCDLRGTDFSGCRGVDEVLTWSETRLYGSVGLSESLIKIAVNKGAIHHS